MWRAPLFSVCARHGFRFLAVFSMRVSRRHRRPASVLCTVWRRCEPVFQSGLVSVVMSSYRTRYVFICCGCQKMRALSQVKWSTLRGLLLSSRRHLTAHLLLSTYLPRRPQVREMMVQTLQEEPKRPCFRVHNGENSQKRAQEARFQVGV